MVNEGTELDNKTLRGATMLEERFVGDSLLLLIDDSGIGLSSECM